LPEFGTVERIASREEYLSVERVEAAAPEIAAFVQVDVFQQRRQPGCPI
jgi:hypothetical protein